MNDKELADAIVALRVGEPLTERHRNGDVFVGYSIDRDDVHVLLADEFVRDWRVAGAMMERCFELDTTRTHEFNPYWPVQSAMSEHQFGGAPLPRAINEACVEALK